MSHILIELPHATLLQVLVYLESTEGARHIEQTLALPTLHPSPVLHV